MRETDMNLGQIGEMIRLENDAEKRNVLLVLHNLTSFNNHITRVLEETERKNNLKLEEHQAILKTQEKIVLEHEKIVISGQTTWKWIAGIFSFVQGIFIGIGIYGYSLIADLRDTVHEQAVVLPGLEKVIDASRQQLNLVNDSRERINQQNETIQQQNEKIRQQDDQIDEIARDIEFMESLKVIQLSKKGKVKK